VVPRFGRQYFLEARPPTRIETVKPSFGVQQIRLYGGSPCEMP
jgi:hypothetical protein